MTCPRTRFWLAVATGAVATSLGAGPANARPSSVDDRQVPDLRDLNRLDHWHPEAGVLFDQAEAALAKGEVDNAARLFQQVANAAPESALALRRLCQVQVEQGLRLSAIDNCKAAIRSGASAMDLRALAAAMVSGPPTGEQMSMALQAARQAKTAMPDQPWGYAAECDIAIRLGDETMFKTCQADLERIAPGHYETRRLEALRSASTHWGTVAVWFLLALATLASALHAAWVRVARASALRKASAAALLPLLLCVASPVRAEPKPEAPPAAGDAPFQGLSKWTIDEKNPSASVPKPEERDANPLQYGYFLMDIGLLADNAVKAQDYQKAALMFEAMAKAVPDEALGYRKACENYEKLGQRERALPLCAGALTVHGVVVDDYLHFAKLQMASTAPLSAEQIEGLNQIVDHLKKESGAEVAAAQVECELGARLEDTPRLRRCTNVLAKLAPTDAKTLTYRWALALQESDFDSARNLIEQAKKAALDPKAIASMQAATAARSSPWAKLAKYWKLGAAALLALGAATALWFATRKRDKLSPTPAS